MVYNSIGKTGPLPTMLTPLKVNIIDNCLDRKGIREAERLGFRKNCHLTKISREIGLHLQSSERKYVDVMNVGIIFYTTSD